jgi:hypothetical protein
MVEIEQVERRSEQQGIIDVVDIESDAGLARQRGVGLADAAQEGADAGAIGALRFAEVALGTTDPRSAALVSARVCSVSAVTAVIAIGVSCMLVACRVAVTTMSASPASADAAAGVGAVAVPAVWASAPCARPSASAEAETMASVLIISPS